MTRLETLAQTVTHSLHLSQPSAMIAFADVLPAGCLSGEEPL